MNIANYKIIASKQNNNQEGSSFLKNQFVEAPIITSQVPQVAL